MAICARPFVCALIGFCLLPFALADTLANKDMGADKAAAKYGATGKGVIVAIMDRGIDYTHPDFRNPDGTTRIKMIWDFSNADPNLGLCDPNQPAPLVYTEAQINTALSGGATVPERDAVGHGTVTAGIATGNGSAVPPSSLQYAGLAPQADLLIVKVTSEGAPAHGNQAPENPFQGCYNLALDLVTQEAATLGEPIVGLINAGVQWGPIDGTGAVSRQIDLDFGLNNPGHVYVEASGDEGNIPDHAQATFSPTAAVVPFTKSDASFTDFGQIWYTGASPANVTITTNDTGATVTVIPETCNSSADGSLVACQYDPGQQFYPWTSSGPDRAVWFEIAGHTGAGSFTVQSVGNTSGTADLYASNSPDITFSNFLTPGRLTDFASTYSADVAGCYNVRTKWVDINNKTEKLTDQGAVRDLWKYSSGGPTRDGRVPPNGGVDVVTPGGNIFAAYGINTYWETFQFNLIQGGQGYYGRQSATSGASPILLGTVAQLLQMDPNLTATQVRQVIHQSATADKFTGTVPNQNWGSGKLNVLGAENLVAAMMNTAPALSPKKLIFGIQKVGTESASQNVTFSNKGTDSLGISSVTVSDDYVISSNNCPDRLGSGGSCVVAVAFKPTQTGTRTGTLLFKDFNPKSPHKVKLTGTGN